MCSITGLLRLDCSGACLTMDFPRVIEGSVTVHLLAQRW